MSDELDPMAEAYHVLGGLHAGAGDAEAELRKLYEQLPGEETKLRAQLEEAKAAGDQAAVERLTVLIDQAQEAWLVAQEALGEGGPTSTGRSGDASPASDPEAASGADQGEATGSPDAGDQASGEAGSGEGDAT